MARFASRVRGVRSHAPLALLLAFGGLVACGSEEAGGSLGSGVSATAIPPGKAECRRWTTCVPANPCHTGWVTGCRAAVPICTDIGGWLANGTTCGADRVCSMGECVPCAAGEACEVTDASGTPLACQAGAIACDSGQPVCEPQGPAPDGTACWGGGPYVCRGGQCTWCVDGEPCTPPEGPCHEGAVEACATTGGTCADTGVPRPNGSSCGDGLVCRAGECVACAWGASCAPEGMPCWAGWTDCSSGEPACLPWYPLPDGEPCGEGLVCSGGACVPPCVNGEACTPPWNACATGSMVCWGPGSGYCQETGWQPDGTSCGPGASCRSGVCQACEEGEPCPSPNPCYPGGATSCASATCLPIGDPLPDGTPCGVAGETCQAAACAGVPGGAVVVRTALGSADLGGTTWSICDASDPEPGGSQRRSQTFHDGGMHYSEDSYPGSPDCSGDPDPALHLEIEASILAAGDRTVGWAGIPPSGLPSLVTATAVTVGGSLPGEEPFSFQALFFVDDRDPFAPRVLYSAEGKQGVPTAPDGYPLQLVTSPYRFEVVACTPDEPCDPGFPTCSRWAIDCAGGLRSCTPREPLPDQTPCGAGFWCIEGSCVPSEPPVTGVRSVTWWPDAGPLPPEPGMGPLSALVVESDGSYSTRPATVGWDGAFSIEGVPQGSYLLKLEEYVNFFVETDARVLDLGQDASGRGFVPLASSSTSLELALANLSPWGARDTVQLATSNVPFTSMPFGQAPVEGIPLGATEVSRVVDWQNRPLLDPALGDETIVYQCPAGTLPGTTLGYRSAGRWASFPGVAILDGQAQTLSATLVDPPAAGALSTAWPIGAYEEHAAEVSPSGSVDHFLFVRGAPHGVPWGPPSLQLLSATGPDLLAVRAPPGTPDTVLDAVPYGRVLPSPWVEYRELRSRVLVSLPNPAGGALTWSGAIVRIDPLASAPADAGPVVTPPLAPLVNGADAFSPQATVGTGPTLSWSPPAVGTPTSYVLLLWSPVPGSSTAAFLRGTAVTRGTSFRFPEGTLEPGVTYFATITARRDELESVSSPLRAGFDADWASLVTATFTP